MSINFCVSTRQELWQPSRRQIFTFDPYIAYYLEKQNRASQYQIIGGAPDVFADAEDVRKNIALIDNYHERYLPLLADRFGAIHGKGSKRFWARVLSLPLWHLLGDCWRIFSRVERHFNHKEHILRIYSAPEYVAFMDMTHLHTQNLYALGSEIFVAEYMRGFYPGLCEELPMPPLMVPHFQKTLVPPPEKPGVFERLRRLARINGKYITLRLAKRLIPLTWTQVGIYAANMDGALVDELFLKSFGRIQRNILKEVPLLNLPPAVVPNAGLRIALSDPLTAEPDKFERYFLRCLERLCPWILAEGFHETYAYYERKWNTFPRLTHLVSESWISEHQMAFALAVAGDMNIQWVNNEHYSCPYLNCSDGPRFYAPLVDTYATSGWEYDAPNAIRAGSLNRPRMPREKSSLDLLLVAGPAMAYAPTYEFVQFPLAGYTAWQQTKASLGLFFQNLLPATKSRLAVKEHPLWTTDNYSIDFDALAGQPLQHLPWERFNARYFMARARLVLLNYISLPFYEALTSDIPLILFWPPDLYHWPAGFEEPLSCLLDAGVAFTDSTAAAEQVERIKDDPDAWWRSSKVQKGIMAFNKKYVGGVEPMKKLLLDMAFGGTLRKSYIHV